MKTIYQPTRPAQHFVPSMPMSMSMSIIHLAVLSTLSIVCFEQANAQEVAGQLREVVVTGAHYQALPKEAGALGQQQLLSRRSYTGDAASLLQDIPGMSFYGAGGASSLPVIRGLADDRLRIKIDGMDLVASCPNHMNPPLSYLDPGSVSSMKVYAGITPVSVGGDSIGGTITADTHAPEFAAPGQPVITKGEVGTYYRSNNRARGANLSASLASDSLSFIYTGTIAKADNYKAGGDFKTTTATGRPGHTLPLDEVGSTAYETRNHALNFATRSGGHLMEAKLGFQEVPKQLYPNQRMEMLGNDQQRINLRYLGQFDWGALEARVYHEKVDHFMDFGADKRYWFGSSSGTGATAGTACAPASSTCAAGMPMYTDSKNTGVTIKADIALNASDLLRLGGEYQKYALNDWWPASGGGMWPNAFWNIKDGQRDRTAAFAEWEGQLVSNWVGLFGIRHEAVRSNAGNVQGYANTNGMGTMMSYQQRDSNAFNAKEHSRTDQNTDITALARQKIDANLDVEIGLARKVRSPNLYERYTWSSWPMAAIMNNFVGDGNGYIGNIDLKPEKAHTISTTFNWHASDRNWEFQASPYYTRVTDYVDAVRVTNNTNQFNVLKYANQTARLYGVDLSGRMPVAKSELGSFELKGILNYTNGKNLDTGDDLYNIMPINTKLALTQKQGRWENTLEFAAAYAKTKVSDARNEVKTSGYGLLHLRSSYTWNQVRLDFGVENLLNKSYSLPLGGAYTGQGNTMSMTAGAPWGTAVPGMGRSLYVGMNVKF